MEQDLSEVQDLEQQILTQTLTIKESIDYFGSSVYAFALGNWYWASTSQIRQLDCSGVTVRRLHTLKVPDPEMCEFCGRMCEYIGVLRYYSGQGWRLVRWSNVPRKCVCEKAVSKHRADEAERARLAKEAQERRDSEERRALVAQQLADSGMKKRFLSRTFENFIADTPERKRAYRAAKDYADGFAERRADGGGLYIEGTVGTGKTHLAAAIAIQLIEQGYNVVFQTADDMLRAIKATYSDNGSESRVLHRLKKCDLLVIDDLGKEQATDWSTAQLYAIINDRYECQRPVVITTNFNETDLTTAESPSGVGSHRIKAVLSRLHESCRLITMVWGDWRGK